MCSIGYVTIPVEQLLSLHPLTHVQLSGAVHCLFLPHGGMQIAVLLWNCIMCSIGYVTIPVEQLMPVHPFAHIQMSGAIHCSFVPHAYGGLQIAMLL